MINKIRNSYHGFTIVELLIYMGLLSIFLLVLIEIFVSMVGVRLESKAASSVEQDGRFIVARFLYDVARANEVVSPDLGEEAGTLTFRIGAVEYTYAITDGNVTLTDNEGVDRLNSSETRVTAARFTRIGNPQGLDTVRIVVTLESQAQRLGQGSVTKTFQTTGGRRQ